MFSKNTKATLLCGPKELSKSFMFEIAMYWAERGRRVVYITPAPLERRPAVCHDRSNPGVAALKLIRFIYLSNYEAFGEQLIKLHTYATVPSVLLINDLDDYFNEESAENDLSTNIAKTCALIFHSMNLCSRVTKINVHVCAWTTSILTNNFLQTIYFRNIWNVTEEEGGKVILLEKLFTTSSLESYKYDKFEDGMRVLQQILYDSEEV
ncbi:hypothetical protein DMN91_004863 [Ooceraea biroi]|uniref:ATPase AAA-type core domain-containing protein n=1 Tax=Ooceraea biroi TaxID=2015173 RepID=A0A026WYW4_OOCBI|nr:uncharacterized protein LOC105287735 [Ooceraea biroi]EZA61240.1 hypothetical protein X777_08452 [Ooceraea biroi]RLU22585.1 hypothetical protein DMN91_004863 [Ooceraea biroi]